MLPTLTITDFQSDQPIPRDGTGVPLSKGELLKLALTKDLDVTVDNGRLIIEVNGVTLYSGLLLDGTVSIKLPHPGSNSISF